MLYFVRLDFIIIIIQDAICLRYNFTIPNRAATCTCGEPNTVDHTLICKRGPFVNCRHNRLRDVISELLNKCLPEVSTEPPLLPVTGESLSRGTTLEPGARLDILAKGFYSPMERAFLMLGCHTPELLPTVFMRPLLRCMLPIRSKK